MKSNLKTFLSKIIFSLNKSAVTVRLTDGYRIHPNVDLKGVFIDGKVNVERGCKLINGVDIKGRSEVNIGRNTSINGPNTNLISYLNAIRIGNYCSIAEGVLFQEYNHNFKRPSTYFFEKNIFRTKQITDVSSKGEIIVGNDVWIGAHSLILSGANIGNGAIIGANSVVIGKIPSYAIAAGSPAKVIKYRFKPEIISQLEKIEWWNWNEEKVLLNKEFFLTDINESTIEAIK